MERSLRFSPKSIGAFLADADIKNGDVLYVRDISL